MKKSLTKEGRHIYALLTKIQRMIMDKAHPQDIDQELNVLSKLTRIRRIPSR